MFCLLKFFLSAILGIMSKYLLVTFGCQMNKNDTERIAGFLDSLGLIQTDNEKEADLMIVNTCSVRQTAEDRVYGLVRNWQKFRKNKSKLIVAVTGCMPGRDKDGKLRKKIKGVDLFFGIEELPMLSKWLEGLNMDLITFSPPLGKGRVEGSLGVDSIDYLSIAPIHSNKFQAFITIQTGCDNYCTYCIVPYARGRQKNRPMEDILAEIKQAVKEGCKEVTLLGQVVNNHPNFVDLLQEINQIHGIERVHFTAPDPQYFSVGQIEALKLSKQVNYLHLPVQSGDNEILKKMNRKYTSRQYIDLINKIRQVKPEIAIGTDIIVGFCGETKEQFQNTVDLYKQCDFDIAYLAMYSERSGTAAAKAFTDNVPCQEKKRRWRELQNLMEETTWRKNKKYQDQIISVLVENCEDRICSGRSREMRLARFSGTAGLVGKIVKVKIVQTDVWILNGKIL